MKHTLITLSALLLIGCGKHSDKESTDLKMDLGVSTYQLAFREAMKDKDTISLKEAERLADSIYKVKKAETLKRFYDEE
jgi:hypothetical protein